MNEEAQYKYEDSQNNTYLAKGSYSIANWPKPVGHWVICPGVFKTTFAMYKKPHRIQIWFTEKLLGWQWENPK